MTPIEKAAQAVVDYTKQRMPPSDSIVTCEGIARAVLQALREPSEGMIEAGRETECVHGDMNCGCDVSWSAMIDAALSE
jgi:hypothetical protein